MRDIQYSSLRHVGRPCHARTCSGERLRERSGEPRVDAVCLLGRLRASQPSQSDVQEGRQRILAAALGGCPSAVFGGDVCSQARPRALLNPATGTDFPIQVSS